MIKEIIAQIGGRDNLVERIKQLQHDSDLGWTAEAYSLKVCKALLSVIDYQPTPAGYVRAGAFEVMKEGKPAIMASHPLSVDGDVKLYTEPPLPGVPDGWRLVPLIAFPSQWAAGKKAFDAAGINKIDPVYRAMVEAAPEYKK